jgi:hypothetical protein
MCSEPRKDENKRTEKETEVIETRLALKTITNGLFGLQKELHLFIELEFLCFAFLLS